jgi:crotonobetainyl-CoA:carnitine CoA-transferase CaiB-like acyl-CoA transferase
LNHIGELLIDAGRTGAVHGALGNRHRTRAPQGCYPCRGEDAWVVLSVGDDAEWAALRTAMGGPEWASDDRYATDAGRREHHDEIDERLAEWTSSQTPREVFERCQSEGVPAAPVLHELDTLSDPHLRERGMFRVNGNDEIGRHEYPTHAWRWDGPDLAWKDLPVLGGDNEAVWKGVVGLTDDDYAALVADGHISRDYLAPDGSSL